MKTPQLHKEKGSNLLVTGRDFPSDTELKCNSISGHISRLEL